MTASFLPIILLGLCLLLLLLERLRLRADVRRLTYRIHVNGTRGKSTVTRYIAAGLRAHGVRTLAKITGIVPTLIGPDGASRPIKRRGLPRVQEQFRTISAAARERCEGLVLECMSILPEYQRLESRFFGPTVTVVTNVRSDHFEEMGKDEAELATVYASAVTPRSVVVLGTPRFLAVFASAARRIEATVVIPPTLSPELQASLPSDVFAENVALAIAALGMAGIPEETALRGMREEWRAADSSRTVLGAGSGSIAVLDGFAVNDVPSADAFIAHWRSRGVLSERFSVLLNTRSDRPLRTRMFVDWCAGHDGIDRIIVTGSHAAYASRRLRSHLPPSGEIHVWSSADAAHAPERMSSLAPGGATFVGLGNIGGDGFRILEALGGKRSEKETAS